MNRLVTSSQSDANSDFTREICHRVIATIQLVQKERVVDSDVVYPPGNLDFSSVAATVEKAITYVFAERLIRNAEVRGSTPLCSTNNSREVSHDLVNVIAQ